jgi:hypothetical protein
MVKLKCSLATGLTYILYFCVTFIFIYSPTSASPCSSSSAETTSPHRHDLPPRRPLRRHPHICLAYLHVVHCNDIPHIGMTFLLVVRWDDIPTSAWPTSSSSAETTSPHLPDLPPRRPLRRHPPHLPGLHPRRPLRRHPQIGMAYLHVVTSTTPTTTYYYYYLLLVLLLLLLTTSTTTATTNTTTATTTATNIIIATATTYYY